MRTAGLDGRPGNCRGGRSVLTSILKRRPARHEGWMPVTDRPFVTMAFAMPTRDDITEALKVVIDPELHRSIVELDMVRSIEIGANGVVDVTVSLTTPGCPIKGHFQTG